MAANIEHHNNATTIWSIGLNHEKYEDYYKVWDYSVPLVKEKGKGEILVVCDGVGSSEKGKEAAKIVCKSIEHFFKVKEPANLTLLTKTLIAANQKVRNLGLDKDDQPIGSCAGTVIWLDLDRKIHIFHVGDTRLILIRDGKGVALTSEHQNQKGHLTNYYGKYDLKFEYKKINLVNGDKLLLFSDGISKAVTDHEIISIIVNFKSRSAGLNALESIARNKGSLDDITAILFEEQGF